MNVINKKFYDLKNFKEVFHKNLPFPHIVIDNFLSQEFYENLNLDKKNINEKNGKQFQTEFEKNKWISKNTELPNRIKMIINELNSELWTKKLSELSNIESVFATKIGNIDLANYHEMKNKGYLGPHVDHSDDPDTGSPHVLNLLLYLSKEWSSEWGGSTLFFDKKGKNIVKEVQYKPNRAIIFLHTPYSFHGVKEILNNKNIRSSIYVDYYSESKNPYKNIKLNFKNEWFKHGTTFVLPKFTDYLKAKNFKYAKTFLKYKFNKFTSN